MFEILSNLGLEAFEIEKLKNFKSKPGFVLIDDREFAEMGSYFKQFPIFANIVAILSDQNSNYCCIYIDGPMKGMICYLDHEEASLEPKFKNITNLLKTINAAVDAYDFSDLDEKLFDFPLSKNIDDFKERVLIIEQLIASFNTETDDDIKQQIAFSIMALTSIDEIENNIYPFLDDPNMYIQERAIRILGFHKYMPAKEQLINLKTNAKHNGKIAIETVLKALR